MAQAKVMNGSKLIVRIDDGSGSNFLAYCSINAARGIEFGSSPIEGFIPDCDNPEEPSWISREVEGKTAAINGSGMFHTPDRGFFWTWYDSGLSRAVQIAISVPAGDGGGYYYGDAVLTQFSVNAGGQRAKAEFECQILSDGEWNWQDAA